MSDRSQLEETLLLQKHRKRVTGVSSVTAEGGQAVIAALGVLNTEGSSSSAAQSGTSEAKILGSSFEQQLDIKDITDAKMCGRSLSSVC